MAVVNACQVPEELYYDLERGAWARLESDGTVTTGFADSAQTRAGKLLHVQFRAPGKVIPRGRPAATVESAKWVGPFPMLFTGEVLAVNAALQRRPVLVNQDPYGQGWLLHVRPHDLAGELGFLVTGEAAVAAYRERLARDKIHCFRCAD